MQCSARVLEEQTELPWSAWGRTTRSTTNTLAKSKQVCNEVAELKQTETNEAKKAKLKIEECKVWTEEHKGNSYRTIDLSKTTSTKLSGQVSPTVNATYFNRYKERRENS